MENKESKDAQNNAWRLFKAARSIFFGEGDSDRFAKSCEKLRKIAESGKLPQDHSDELLQRIGNIEESGLTAQSRDGLEHWYMHNYGEWLRAGVKEQQFVFFFLPLVTSGFFLHMAFSSGKQFNARPSVVIIAGVGGVVLFTIFTWLYAWIFLRKPRRLLSKYYGKGCLPKQ